LLSGARTYHGNGRKCCKVTVHWIDLNGDFAAIVAVPINENDDPKATAVIDAM
jgi:hypothetical protein